METVHKIAQGAARKRPTGGCVTALLKFLITMTLSSVPLVGVSTTAARACACGCSVFDVGGLGMPQEEDHGGSVFFEFETGNQTENYIGTSRVSNAFNSDKEISTLWYNVGFTYQFNRDWGVMVRVPLLTDRTLVTDTGSFEGITSFNSKSFGDLEVMGMYTGFFKDMSTGVIFGLKLPTGIFTAPGIDRDTQVGSGSTDLLLGGFQRGLLSPDNSWQYFSQIMWRRPFLYQSAPDPQGFFDGNLGVVQTYHPGQQIDGVIGVNYNNWYNVAGFDKITPLAQLIFSHRDADTGTGSDPFNSGFDRVMFSPGIELTKVVDEANNRVVKFYGDVEIPIYYRANAADNAGTEGQLIAPYLVKVVGSYHF